MSAPIVTSDIFPPNYSVTGIRSEDDANTGVIMTGSRPVYTPDCPGDSTNTVQAMLYRGPMGGSGQFYTMIPPMTGGTICSSIFYGPNTHYFNPLLIEAGQVRAVGTYKYQTDPNGVVNHGVMYEGPLAQNGVGGTWTSIDMPIGLLGDGKVINTIPHSTMGDLVVGDYERVYIVEGKEVHEFGAFIYHIYAKNEFKYQRLDLGYKAVTAYGIWQNGKDTTSYTIAGGLDQTGNGFNVGYLVDYDSDTIGVPVIYKPSQANNFVTHFEGITNLERGMPESAPSQYSLAATGDADRDDWGPTFAIVERMRPNGSLNPNARWQSVPAPSGASANTVLTNNVFGVYLTDNQSQKGIQSYRVSDL
jgi:hypothetical protein